jgi:hypothetical protein
MVHYLLPYMILALYGGMVGIDRGLCRAAQTLGASRGQAFRRVFLPLSLPAVFAGSMLVFILATGFFVVPSLLGGSQEMTLAVYIERQTFHLNWGSSATAAVLLSAISMTLFMVVDRLVGLDRLFGGLAAREESASRHVVRDHHELHGSTGTGRITAANPREGFVGGDPERGLYVHPTLVSGVRAEDELANTETFGPLVGVARFEGFDEALALANGHGYGLSAAIYTRSPEHAFRFRAGVTAGMVSVNNSTSGAEAHLPFGGNGKSGNGSRQSGIWVLDQFTRWQSMNWDYAGKLQKAQMDLIEIEAQEDFRLEERAF